MIFREFFEVFRQGCYPFCEESNLDLGRAGILFVDFVILDDSLFLFRGKRHVILLIY